METIGIHSAKGAAELLGLTHIEMLRRLNRGDIPGAQKMGWNWVIPDAALDQVRQADWYKKWQKAHSENS